MNRATVLVRYGEVAPTRGGARRQFERALAANMIEALSDEGLEAEVQREPGRMFVATDEPDAAAARLRDVFGVASCSITQEAPVDLPGLVRACVRYAAPHLPRGATFAVRARRSGDHPFSSLDVAREVGAALQRRKRSLRVDLARPDVEVFVEVRQKHAFLFREQISGVGGIPLGLQGRCVVLLNDGANALVAAWLMMRRGCVPLFLHLDTAPHGPWGPDEAFSACRPLRRFAAGTALRFHSVPFGEVLSAIAGGAQQRHLCSLCRRAAVRAAALVAAKGKAELIVTGGTLGHGIRHSPRALAVEDAASELPVVRPLVGLGHVDLARWARRAGLDPTASLPSCCELDARGQEPRTDLQEVADEEMVLDLSHLITEAVELRERRVL